jgi:CheY-like chemotaxis protein
VGPEVSLLFWRNVTALVAVSLLIYGLVWEMDCLDDTSPAPVASAATAASLRVLLVEDNDDARDMLRTVLRLAGHEVHEAADGVTALRMATELRPHVALIDLGLPGLDGLEVGARLRASADGERPLLVAVTGYGQQADRERTRRAGFDLHLTKPVDPERLTEAVSQAARRSCARTAS